MLTLLQNLLAQISIHIHQLQTLYHICGINRQPRVSQGSKSQSRQGTPSVTATCLVTLPVTPAGSCFSLVSSFFLSSFFILPAQPQDTVFFSFLLYPAGAAAGSCFLLVSFFFLLLSSFFFWQHAFFTHFPTSYFDQT